MRTRGQSAIIITCAGILIFLIVGCTGSAIRLKSDRYMPLFSASEYGEYKGKQIYLYNIANHAGNSKIFYYRSETGRDPYESIPSPLDAYFWVCFKKAFEHGGLEVWEKAAPAGVPSIQIVFDSISDRKFTFEVTLKKESERLFQKVFLVAKSQPPSQDPVQLEQGAYRMLDESVTAILKDSDFKKAFLK
jgi:hypothetical protein